MRALLLVVLGLTACTTHHRVTVGPTFALDKPDEPAPQPGDPKTSPPSKVGVDATGELTGGGDAFRGSLAVAARAGHGATSAGFRVGVSLGTEPRPGGVRGSFSLGPTFTSSGATLDVRGGLGVDYGFVTGSDSNKRTTVGLELFISSVGTGDDQVLMVGLGLSAGWFHHDSLGVAASPPAD